MEPEPDFLMQLALTALKASHRDAAWLASAALDNAMHRALEDGYSGGGVVGNINDHERSSASILHQGVGRGLVPAGAGAE